MNRFKIVDKAFSFILANVIPPHFCRHFADIDKPVTMSLAELNSFSKMTKLQKADYMKQNNVTYIEEKLSELNLTKSQYEFMTQHELLSE